MRTWIPFLLLALVSVGAKADETVINLPKSTVNVGISVDVPASAKILTISAKGDNGAPLELYLKDEGDFDVSAGAPSLFSQAQYFSNNNSGTASLAIGTYATPALHEGTWHIAILNRSSLQSTNVTLTTSTSNTAKVPTDFEINFGAAPSALEDAWGGADKLECDVDPWTDTTPLGDTTLGAFRQSLLKDTLNELSTQIHSPVPVHIQACWKEFDDSGAHAGSYTLAAATGTYIFSDDAGMPLQNTWYSMAPAERLAGHRNCNYYSDVDCSIPEIIVWFNSADKAAGNYDSADDEPLIRSVTMHEITHGLGFLSQLSVSEKDDDDNDNPDYLKFHSGRVDAYSVNVGYATAPEDDSDNYKVTPLADLDKDGRLAALTSGQFLVWNDPTLANSSMNVLRNRTPPRNLVELHAPSEIQPGSTLSHLSAVHHGQLMDAVIQSNFPQTLGLAAPMLARVGWNTVPPSFVNTPTAPIPGNWYDPAHSGHGIDLEPITRDPAGDQYAIIFYTYDSNGKSEYYYSAGRLKDEHLGSFDDPGTPAAIGRPIYDPSSHKATYPDGTVGTLAIDFSAAAANDPACAARTGESLAVMNWSIGPDSGSWCISPLLGYEPRPAPSADFNGLWNAGSSDSGWGMSITEGERDSGKVISPLLLYYYDRNNQPRWAQADFGAYAAGEKVDLYDVHGYCRSCAKVPTTRQAIGNITLGLERPEHVELPSGDNTVTIGGPLFGGFSFRRSDTALRMYSLPARQ